METGNTNLGWRVVAALWIVCFLNYADRQALSSLFPLLQSDLRLSTIQLGVVGSSFMWMYAFSGPVAGWLGDRWSRRWLILGGLGLWILLEFCAGIAHSYRELSFIRGLSGLAEAFYFPAALALISAWHGAHTRSRALSVHQSAVYIGSIAGGSFGGILGQHFGWRSNFLLFGAAGILIAVPVALVLSKAEPPKPAKTLASQPRPMRFFASARSLLSVPGVPLLILIFMGANFVAMALMTWLPYFLHAKFAWSLTAAGVNGTLYVQVASVFGVLTGGLLADKLVRRIGKGRMLTQAFGLLGGVTFIALIGSVRLVPLLLTGMLGFGFCKGIYDSNIFASLYDLIPAGQRSSAAGLMNSLGWVGGGFAPIVIAMGSNHVGMGVCLSATSLLYLMLGVAMLFGVRRSRPNDPM